MALTADVLPVSLLADDPAAGDLLPAAAGWLDDLIADAAEVTRRLAELDLPTRD